MQLIEKDMQSLLSYVISRSNSSVFVPKIGSPPYDKVPYSIFFVYLAWGQNAIPDVRHYFTGVDQPIAPDQIDGFARFLAMNARNNDPHLKAYGKAFQGLEWNRISYLMFAMDSPVYRLWSHASGGTPLFFDDRNGKQGNHSFFDGMDLSIDMSPKEDGSEKITGIACINHMKRSDKGDILGNKPNGTPGPTERQYYKFSLAYVTDALPGVVMTYDPDGTNVGPPPPPPFSLRLAKSFMSQLTQPW